MFFVLLSTTEMITISLHDALPICFHAIEEVYELLDAIESGDDAEMREELGDLLLQVVFHCQLARERGAFDFEKVAREMTEDRKSTRLNSSHSQISYAVFCLK